MNANEKMIDTFELIESTGMDSVTTRTIAQSTLSSLDSIEGDPTLRTALEAIAYSRLANSENVSTAKEALAYWTLQK